MQDYFLIFMLLVIPLCIGYLLYFTFKWWKNSNGDENFDEFDSDN